MIKITVEELDIIVQASVEQALTEFKKIVPQLKKTIKQVEDNLNNVETKGMVTKVQQAVQQVKQKVNEVKNTGIDKQLQSQFDKAGASVEKYQGQLEQTKEKLRQVYASMDNIQANTWKRYTPEGIEVGNKAIEPTVNNALGNNKQYQGLSKEANKLEQQITSLKSKLNTTKQEYNQISGQIQEINSKQGIWGTTVSKVRSIIDNVKKSIKGAKNNFEGISTVTEKVKSGCSQILGVTTKITTRIKQMGTGFKKGLIHILKYAGALFSLQSIYSGLSNIANTWLSSQNAGAQQLSANIEYMKYAMGSALAPAIQLVINLIYQLMKAIQSVVYALTGINIFANASAKAYSNMAGSAKKAAKETKQLAGVHDEINNIQETNPESGSGGGSVSPSFDLSQVDSQMSAFAQKLYEFFKPLKDSWDIYGPQLVEQIKTTASQVGYLISSVWDSFEKIITNGTVYSILENILAIIGSIAQAWGNAWNYNNNGDAIVQNLANAFNNLLVAINNVVSSPAFQEWLNNCSDKFREISEKIASIDWQPLVNALAQLGSTIGTVALDILSGLVDIFKWLVENPTVAGVILGIAIAISTISSTISTLGPIISTVKTVITGLSSAFGALSSAFSISTGSIGLIILAITALIAAAVYLYQNFETVRNIVNGAIESIKETFVSLYNEHLKPLIDNIISLLKTLWNDILQPLISWIVENILPVLAPIFESLWNTISSVVGSIMDVLGGVIEALKGVIEFIAGVFSGDWEKAWQGIKDFFSGIWDTIKGIVSAVWNTISGIITTAVNTIKGTITAVFNAVATIVSNIWNGIWNAIRGVINSILGGIEGMANGVVNGINWVTRALNNLSFDVPDWVPGIGGSKFGFNIPQLSRVSLPRLAKGAVLKVPTVAEMAEYPGASTNPEIVTPQNIMEETFDRVLSRYQDNNNGQPIYLTVNVGNKKLGQVLLDDLKDKKRRTGNGIEALVGG